MGNAVRKIIQPAVSRFEVIVNPHAQRRTVASAKEILTIGIILAILQILDGTLTAIGMKHFGTGAEANVLIRSLMDAWGYIPALVFVKGIALFVIAALCYLARSVAWLPFAMKGVIAVYLCAAVIPWSFIVATKVF